MNFNFEIDKTYTVKFPFVRTVYTEWDIDGSSNVLSWKPGVHYDNDGDDNDYCYAHGEGFVKYHVVDVHKLPRPYPARVFYVRTWIDPDGKEFGKTALRMTTIPAFTRRLEGFKTHPALGFDNQYEVIPLADSDKERLLKAA